MQTNIQYRLINNILLFLSLIVISVAASAYDVATMEEAASAYKKGFELVESENWPEAIKYLKRSYNKVPAPMTAYLISIASSRLQNVTIALEYARKAVEGKPPLKKEYISGAKEIIAWAEDYPDIPVELMASADVMLPAPPTDMEIPSSPEFPGKGSTQKKRRQLQGVYTIQQKSNGRYVDAHEGSHDNAMVTRKKQRNDTQRWILTPLGNNIYTIQQKSNSRYVDAHVGTLDHAMVTRDRQKNDTQRWIIK